MSGSFFFAFLFFARALKPVCSTGDDLDDDWLDIASPGSSSTTTSTPAASVDQRARRNDGAGGVQNNPHNVGARFDERALEQAAFLDEADGDLQHAMTDDRGDARAASSSLAGLAGAGHAPATSASVSTTDELNLASSPSSPMTATRSQARSLASSSSSSTTSSSSSSSSTTTAATSSSSSLSGIRGFYNAKKHTLIATLYNAYNSCQYFFIFFFFFCVLMFLG